MPTKAELRANETQMESVRRELHNQIDALVDAWPDLDRQSREMGRGFPSGGEGGSCSCDPEECNHGGSSVERAALSNSFDPALAAHQWLSYFEETRARIRFLYGRLKKVLPVDPASVERGRQNSVEICSWCNEPAPRVKRLDGAPFCHPDLGKTCWRTAYDTRRRAV